MMGLGALQDPKSKIKLYELYPVWEVVRCILKSFLIGFVIMRVETKFLPSPVFNPFVEFTRISHFLTIQMTQAWLDTTLSLLSRR